MKKPVQQASAILLSFLLLFSTLSLQLDMHFCGHHLVDFGIGREAATCGMELSPEAGESSECIMAVMDCCTDIELNLTEQVDFKPLPADELPLPIYTEVPLTAFMRIQPLVEEIFSPSPGFREYSPPPIIRKAHLLYETFLL